MKKRICLFVMTLLIAGCVVLQQPGGEPFANPHLQQPHGGLWAYFKTRAFGPEQWARVDADEYQMPLFDGVRPTPSTEHARITWVGHATVLIEYRGVAVLTDPHWSRRASPVQFAGPARFSEPGLAFAELPSIDAVVISHDHYDHLDTNTIALLGDQPMYFVPSRVDEWLLDQGISAERVVALDWWQGSDLASGARARFTALPAQHFSGRGVFGRNQTLWASWAIEIADLSIYFGGDTGYNPVQFKQIGERFGGFDFAIVPIGAYRPRSFMQAIHVDPAEALQIHQDVGARQSLGVHWGAFMLAAEHPQEVERDLALARQAQGIASSSFATWKIGEARLIAPAAGDGISVASARD